MEPYGANENGEFTILKSLGFFVKGTSKVFGNDSL